MTDRTSIRWYMPGDMSIEYVGDPKPLWPWIALTWRSYLAFWNIWLACAGAIIADREFPWPSRVANLARDVIAHFVSKARLAAAMKADPA